MIFERQERKFKFQNVNSNLKILFYKNRPSFFDFLKSGWQINLQYIFKRILS